MNSNQISALCNSDPMIHQYFAGVYGANELPKTLNKIPFLAIVNTDPSNLPGSHWVAIFVYSKDGRIIGEFFDSFGKKPEVYDRSFKHFFDRNCSFVSWNRSHLQKFGSNVCGQYCIYFAFYRCRFIPMSTLIGKTFTKNKKENDNVVNILIHFLFKLG